MNPKVSSDLLFARPSFISGMARILDLGGFFNSYNFSEQADSQALFADWCVVGQDIENAIAAFETPTPETTKNQSAQYELFTPTVR
jgi:hypothetical protein